MANIEHIDETRHEIIFEKCEHSLPLTVTDKGSEHFRSVVCTKCRKTKIIFRSNRPPKELTIN